MKNVVQNLKGISGSQNYYEILIKILLYCEFIKGSTFYKKLNKEVVSFLLYKEFQ